MAEKKYLDENGLLYVWSKIKTLLGKKVDKVEGMGLSHNDLTDELKQKILNAGDSSFDGQYTTLTGKPQINSVELKSGNNTLADLGIQAAGDYATNTDLDNKVDKVDGKGLSTNDFTDAEKTKLAGMTAGANANVIESIKVNGVAQTVATDKSVNITVPTKVSELTNDSDFVTTTDLSTDLDNKVDKVDGKGLSTNDFTTAEKNKLTGIETGAQVNKIETISVNGTEQTITDKGVDITIPSGAEYTIAEVTTTEGYSKTYSLKKDGAEIGAKINIPKDLVIESGTIKTVATADTPYTGAVVGDKYLDITLNDSTADHIYIPVNELVDAYTAGNGIGVSASNEISVKVDAAKSNGLVVGADGLGLDVATGSKNGAMSSAMVTKLSGIDTGAEVNKIDSVKVNGVALAITDKGVDITTPTKVSELTNDSGYLTSSSLTGYLKTTDIVAITNAEIDTIFES